MGRRRVVRQRRSLGNGNGGELAGEGLLSHPSQKCEGWGTRTSMARWEGKASNGKLDDNGKLSGRGVIALRVQGVK
jgi:hypothetical protein